MINLKELEQKLDNALDKETTESLSNWLSDKRNKMEEKIKNQRVTKEFMDSLPDTL